MTTARPGTHERTQAYPTGHDSCIGRALGHHSVPPRDGVPNMRIVSEESFFHRNLQIPKDIQAHNCNNGALGAGQSIELEGEVPVTFYDYFLDSGRFKYVIMPLQYLYKNYGEAMVPERLPSFFHHVAAGEPAGQQPLLVEQPLRIMEFPTCYYAKDFLEAFSSEGIWNLLNRGDDLRLGVSFQLLLDSQHFSIAISIPYLGVEKEISTLTRSTRGPGEANAQAGQPSGASGGLHQSVLKRMKGLTDFGEGRRLSWPRESSRLTQNVGNPQSNSVDEHFILKHRAGIILLNTGTGKTLAIFRSCDDKNSERVPLLPHQKSTNALDAFLNVLSNTLKSSERAVLDNLCSKASNYSSNFQEFARKSDTARDFGDRLILDSATLSGELSAVIDVAKSQKRHIKDLQEFLARLSSGPNHPNGLLQLSSQSSEQKKMLSAKIHFMLEERQAFLDEVNGIFLEVKVTEKSFYQLSTLRASQRLCEETVYEMKRQGRKFRKAWWKRIIPSQEKVPTRGDAT
ncbi:hypothetical protein B9Z19DRAFT_1098394 [Tuber borchii]|uniref:Uncharacterized protein n=1 Tax=Tuber borchii TaxID=42251 RepID=A0A2T7A8F0_TUBBO|nr:hypothetical protein B9Z19DRAFT_1098394 [Tuber borchii]